MARTRYSAEFAYLLYISMFLRIAWYAPPVAPLSEQFLHSTDNFSAFHFRLVRIHYSSPRPPIDEYMSVTTHKYDKILLFNQ